MSLSKKCWKCQTVTEHSIVADTFGRNSMTCDSCSSSYSAECVSCKSFVKFRLEPRDDQGVGNHGLVCPRPECGRGNGWSGIDREKKRRPSSHQKLVKKFSDGYCEMCLRFDRELRPQDKLVGHHVIEYSDGGDDERANVWILCTACHALIHNIRTYHGHDEIVSRLAARLVK